VASRGRGTDLAAFAAIGMAAGLCGLGALSLIYQDYALQWEPVPKSWPAHAALGAASGLILLVSGIMMAMRRTRVLGAALAAVFIGLWGVLQIAKLAPDPVNVGAWNAVAECVAMATGAGLLIAELRRGAKAGSLVGRLACILFGVTLVVFGTAHFVYARFTASMIPAWLPMRLQLAYFTGAIHALMGLALVIGVQRRWAATIEALMMTSFVLLVHLPRVAAKPGDRTELTLLFVAVTLSSAAWIVASSRAVARR
jgi:uncharacterized membrane protein YphA (DoxX/SURF4 family)